MTPTKKLQVLNALLPKLKRASNLGSDCMVSTDEATVILELADKLARTVKVKK